MTITPQYLSAETHWLKGVACGIALSGAVYGSLIYSDYQAEPWGSENKPTVERIKVSSVTDGSYALTFGPTRSLLFRSELRMNGVSEYEALVNSLNWLGVYTLVLFGLKGLQRSFFITPIDKFLEKTNKHLQAKPESVIFLDMIGNSNKLSGYPEAIFKKFYTHHKDAKFVSFQSLNELNEKLLELKGQTFDRIEIMGHAEPGKIGDMKTTEGKISISALTEMISQLPFTLTHSKSEVRLIACSLLNGIKLDSDFQSTSMSSFVKSILPSGGTFVGGTKNIMMFELTADAKGFGNNESLWLDGGMVFLSYVLNAEALRTIFGSLFSLNRNYLDSLNDVKVRANAPVFMRVS